MGTHLATAKVLCQELKRLIRKSRYSYSDLARQMNLSVSGLKKILSKEDISTSRLIQFCDVLGLSLNDLVKSTEDQNFIDFTFTKEQEALFASDYKFFMFYWFLVYERRHLDEIKKTMSLTPAVTEKILVRLDRLNLIGYLASGKIRLPSPAPIRWIGNSKFVRDLYKTWGKLLLHDLVDKPRDNSSQYFLLRYLQMPEDSFKELIALLTKIEKTALNKSTRQMRTNKSGMKHVRWLTCIDQQSWAEQELRTLGMS